MCTTRVHNVCVFYSSSSNTATVAYVLSYVGYCTHRTVYRAPERSGYCTPRSYFLSPRDKLDAEIAQEFAEEDGNDARQGGT